MNRRGGAKMAPPFFVSASGGAERARANLPRSLPSPPMIVEDPDSPGMFWIHHEQPIAVHHEDVFACLTTAAGLCRWLAVDAQIDAEPGGLIVLAWDRGWKSTTTVAILEIDAGGSIVWDWQAAASDQHAPLYWQVLPSVESGSIVGLRQGPFKSTGDSLRVMAEEAQHWTWYLCNLRGVLEAKHDMRAVRPL